MNTRRTGFLNTVLRRFLYGFGFFVVLLAVILGIVGFTSPGARLVAALIERYASTPDQIVRITDPGPLLTGGFSASSVTLFDSKGIYAEIRGLDLDWTPTALLSGRFDASRLTAETVRLERLPVPSQETQEVRSSFALPVDVKIDTLDARDILIGKDIAGSDQHLTLLGNLAVTNSSIASKLALSQPDRPQAKAMADIVFDPAANALKLDLDIKEPKGGMIAKSLQLPGDPAVGITISGNGPLSNWSGSAVAALDGTQIVKLDGGHHLADNGAHTVSLSGGGQLADLLPPGLRPLFEGTTTVDLAGAFESGTLLRIDRGMISTGALSLAASGTMDTKGENNLQASLTGVNGPVDLSMAMGDGTARLSVNTANLSLIGHAATTVIDIGADLGPTTLPQGNIDSIKLHAYSDSFDLTNRTGTLKTSVQTGATRFSDANLDRLVKGPVKLDGTIGVSPDKITFDPLTLESASIGGTVTGDYSLQSGATTASLKLFALPATLPPALAGRFDTTIALAGDLSLSGTGNVAISNLAIKSGPLQAAGSLAYENESLNAALSGTVPDLGRFLADAKGAATFKADITGPVEGLTIAAQIESTGATLAGRTLEALVIKADATTSGNRQDANITATGTLEQQPIDVRTSLFAVNGKVSVPSLEAEIGSNKLTGALELDNDFQPNGALDFNLPDIGLIAAIAGQNATGDLTGSAKIATSNGITAIAVKANGTNIESGDLTIVKPQADITIADLQALAVRGTVSVEAIAQGDNRLSGLAVDFTRQGERTDMALTGTYDDAPLLLNANLMVADGQTDINVTGFEATPAQFHLKLAAPATISIANGAVKLNDVSVNTPVGTIRLNGTAGERLDLKANLAGNPDSDYAVALSEGEARLGIQSADVTVVGTLNAAVIDVAAALRSATLPQGRLDGINLTAHSDAFNIPGRTGTLSANLETAATSLANADIARLATGTITVDAMLGVTPETIEFTPVSLTAAYLGGTVNGAFDMASSVVTAAFDLTVKPEGLPDAAASKFDTPVRLAGNLATGDNGAVNLTDLAVDSGTIEATGALSMADGKLESTLNGTLPDLGKLLADAKGQAKFSVAASGPLDALAVKADITSSGATLAGRTLSDLIVKADATLDKNNPKAAVTATGALAGQVIDVKATVQSKDGRSSIPLLQARVGDNVLNGRIDFSSAFLPTGTIDFTFPDVALLAAMAGQKASGDIAGSAAITSTDGKTSLALKASGTGVQSAGLTITKPRADLTIADLKTLAIKGSLSVDMVAQGENRLSGITLDFSQQADGTEIVLDGNYDGSPLSARGAIRNASGRTDVALSSFSAAPRRIPLRLDKPTTISIVDGIVDLSDLVIRAGGGTIAVTGKAGSALDLDARLTALPASLANTFAPTLGADGAISGTVKATGTTAAPVVAYDLRWANAALAQTRAAGVGSLDITAKGRFADNVVAVDAGLSGGGGLSFKGNGSVGVTGNRPLDLKLNGTLPFGLAGALLADQGLQLSGQASVDLTVGGTAASPQINGTVSTSGARLLDVRRNLAVNDLAARVTLSGQQATISSLSGKLASGGSVSASGSIGLANGYPADIGLKLVNAVYVDGTLFTATVNGDMTLTGPLLATPTLGGKVTIVKAAITIPEKLPASLSEINIKHRNAPADVRRMEAKIDRDKGGDGAASGGIAFDLAVVSPGKMFVRGRGIDAELGGNLTIRGTAANPLVSGGFQLRRGRLEILGKRLDFSKGTISFGGGLVPTVDLVATSTAGSTTVNVNVAGVANNPAITFSSSPALPQDEILAQLIFNRSLSNLSALQIAQLASAVSQLAGGQGGSLLDGLRNKLGVDDLDVTTDTGGGALVRAGKYLNDRTYIELQQGGDDGGTKATINLDIGRGFKLQGNAGTQGGGGGVFYEKEY